MINSLYKKYFQKSRTFLYPALGIGKREYTPLQTYVALDTRITSEEMKLICLYEHKNISNFKKFEDRYLLRNPLYQDSIISEDQLSLYVFDYSPFADDWEKFLEGKYSKLSPELKRAIKNYYGTSSGEYEYVDTYLYPEKYYKLYSDLLDEPIEIIKSIGELCNPYDPEKELLKFSPKYLESIQDKSVSLPL